MEKKCSMCGRIKPSHDFHRKKDAKDRLHPFCKPCQLYYNKHHRFPNEEALRLYNREYAKTRKRDHAKLARWKKEHPEMCRAHRRLNYAVKNGKIQKPMECGKCGESSVRLVAHHPNYAEPLKVLWLCDACHYKTHKEA